MELIGWGVDFPRSYLAVLLWREIAWLKERKREREKERKRKRKRGRGRLGFAGLREFELYSCLYAERFGGSVKWKRKANRKSKK